MADTKENPERIWTYSWTGKEGYQGQWDYFNSSTIYGNVSKYVRDDLYDALAKDRDELVEELTAFENEVYKREADFAFKMGKLEARAEQAEAEVERLREALHVFASAADGRRRKDWLGGVCFQQDVLLSARETLQRKEENE